MIVILQEFFGRKLFKFDEFSARESLLALVLDHDMRRVGLRSKFQTLYLITVQ